MMVRTADAALAAALSRARDRLLPSETFEGNEHLATLTLSQVSAQFWPPEEGWRTVSVETGLFYVFHLFEHAAHGVGACLLGATPPGRADVPAPLASERMWAELAVEIRSRNIWLSLHAHGPSRLDLLTQFVRLYEAGEMTTSDESMLSYLLHSSVFMDETTRVMVSLDASFDPLVQRARQRHERESAVLTRGT